MSVRGRARRSFALLTASALLAGGLLAGCGGSSGGSGAVDTLTDTASVALPPILPTTTTTTTTSTTTSTSSSASTSTVTEMTTNPSLLPGTNRPTVHIGDMNTPEQFVLGELYTEALQAEGYSVVLTRNVGAVPIRLDALRQGTLDLYPEYLNVWDSAIVGDLTRFATEPAAYAAGQAWAEAHGLRLLTASQASDTQGLALAIDFAEAGDLHTFYGLKLQAPSMVFGVPPGYAQSEQGLLPLERAYGFKPGGVASIDLGDQYNDLDNGTIQAAYVNTTDPQLATGDYRLLADPLHVLGFGNVVPVVTQRAIAAEGPAFAVTVDEVSALLSTSALQTLNAEVERTPPQTVADRFLRAAGLVPSATPG